MSASECAICGEQITSDLAEMYDPESPEEHGGLVHAECGLARGWAVA